MRRAGSFLAMVLMIGTVCFAQQSDSSSAPATPHKSTQKSAQKRGTTATKPKPKGPSTAAAESAQKYVGTVSGTVIDQGGALAVGAQVKLTRDDQSAALEVASGDNGEFSFTNLAPGLFHITVTAPGFDTQQFAGELNAGQVFLVPAMMLSVAAAVTEVRVGVSPVEVAEVELKEQEKQRVFGIIPNFYVTYVPDAAPLIPRQKFRLAWRSVRDPFTFVAVGMLAGFQQASDQFGGYGQGAEGYAKRYGASYANVFAGTFIGSAILPSLLKHDPRYFYQGEDAGTRSRLWHALGNSIICKGDNKKWQVNYSGIGGSFATGAVSYLYYPPGDRNAGLFVQQSMIRVAESSLASLFQEFVLPRLTTNSNVHDKMHP